MWPLIGTARGSHGLAVDSLLSAKLEQEGSATEGRTSSDSRQVRSKDPEADSPAAKKKQKVEVPCYQWCLSRYQTEP